MDGRRRCSRLAHLPAGQAQPVEPAESVELPTDHDSASSSSSSGGVASSSSSDDEQAAEQRRQQPAGEPRALGGGSLRVRPQLTGAGAPAGGGAAPSAAAGQQPQLAPASQQPPLPLGSFWPGGESPGCAPMQQPMLLIQPDPMAYKAALALP